MTSFFSPNNYHTVKLAFAFIDEIFVIILLKYLKPTNILFLEFTAELAKHANINDNAIELVYG